MSDSVRPHRWQPTRLPHPWDSPGKNPGVGCHFLSNTWKWKVRSAHVSKVKVNWLWFLWACIHIYLGTPSRLDHLTSGHTCFEYLWNSLLATCSQPLLQSFIYCFQGEHFSNITYTKILLYNSLVLVWSSVKVRGLPWGSFLNSLPRWVPGQVEKFNEYVYWNMISKRNRDWIWKIQALYLGNGLTLLMFCYFIYIFKQITPMLSLL